MYVVAGVDLCQYFAFALIQFCSNNAGPTVENQLPVGQQSMETNINTSFVTSFEWTVVNYTWPSIAAYQEALLKGTYIPENNAIVGLKFYKNRMYLAIPRIRQGTPVTLASAPVDPNRLQTNAPMKNILLEPFPSWEGNVQLNCSTLQNVQSMEIDRRGILWVLDGTRLNKFTQCPPKIVLHDLKRNNTVVQSFDFPPEICLPEGGFLNDIVIDEGGYAYITDTSTIDPGLIVYSRRENRAWKLRDRSMFPEPNAANFIVDSVRSSPLVPIDGIALSPIKASSNERTVFYSALSGFNMYAISNAILRNETFSKSDQWRMNVKHVGRKADVGDGMIIDNQGNMYYGGLQTYSIATWNIYKNFSTENIVTDTNRIIWPDSFAMDDNGYTYVLCNSIHKLIDPNQKLSVNNEVKVRIIRWFVGNRSYLFKP